VHRCYLPLYLAVRCAAAIICIMITCLVVAKMYLSCVSDPSRRELGAQTMYLL
jgi:hypothetical protein